MTNQEVNRPDTRKKLFFGLFVFPLLIAVGMALLLATVVFLTKEDETPESLIHAIKTGAPSKRWQKAFELSNELNRQEGMIRSAGIMNEVVYILNDKDHYDAKTRAYMAMALGRFHNQEAEGALLAALKRVDDDEDPEVPLFLMWSVGNFQNAAAANDVARFLESKHGDLRKTAAYVLGVLGNRGMAAKLVPLLEDPVNDVQWNAALSLARLGSAAGSKVLIQMLNHSVLKNVHQMNDSQIEPVMLNAAKAFSLIKDRGAVSVLESISKSDENLKVRQAALAALEYQNKL